MKKLKQSIFDALSILFLVAFTTCAVCYLVFGLTLGPTIIRNQFISFWLNLIGVFHSLQTIFILKKPRRFITNNFFYFDVTYFTLCSIASLLLIIFYAFASTMKIDEILFSCLLLIITLLNSFLLVFLRQNYKNRLQEAGKEKENYQLKENKEPPNFFEGLLVDDKETCGSKCLRIFNMVFKFLFLIILGFLVAGAWTIGTGYLWYPPRGQFSTVKLNDSTNRQLKIHWLCDGPIDDSQPVFLFDGSGSHVMADYYGLHIVLKEQNRRSCIFDLPGQGFYFILIF